MSGHDPSESVVLRVLRTALHLGFYLLLAVATARLFATHHVGGGTMPALLGVVTLAVLYAVGALPSRVAHDRRTALLWLAGVTGLWAALLVVSPDFSWIAFPLFFLHMHLLRRTHAVLAVAVLTGAVIATQLVHAEEFSVAMVLGPSLGAGFAVLVAWGYAAVHEESQQRRRLIEDLRRTRSQLAASQHEAGVAAERERLAREIHDTIAQGLSSVVLLLRAAEAALPAEATTARGHLVEARDTASENLAEARGFVRRLSPPALDDAGLPETLRRLCERVERESGLRCRSRVDGTVVTLPAEYEVALLRAAQASLANVVQHAGADSVTITLGYLRTEVTLDVYDDGVGFDPELARAPRADGTGFGLPSLRERIDRLGGELELESTGDGTAVAIRLPLREEVTR
ncbi:sensor histidine kinase [Actinopolyspora erythraea]|uniref:Oxygen sensor histidine kinase NreB n=1 Tax=Actinopolyspora erythraea TaxID=414996 RepID=A0A099D0L2_9ACTN|nr:sensor histidine kinase [Actinopolyspora erythraea]ASU78003.1 sensor histidine kinase [Actinopolyspora erythraea]KGI79768.1 histidine kinase [Actinopolyspora erythraea]